MALRVTAGSTGLQLLIDTGDFQLVSGFGADAFLFHDGTVVATSTAATATPIVPPLVQPSGSDHVLAIHTGGTAFLPTATLDHGVLATTGTMGSAVLAGSLAPLGDQFAHAISDWLLAV